MNDGFSYSNFAKKLQQFENIQKQFENFLKTFLLQQAQRCIASAKRNTPVDTGFLRASWIVGSEANLITLNSKTGKYTTSQDSAFAQQASIDDVKFVGDTMEVTVANSAEYASYVEYGHASPSGSWVEGKFMLTIAIDEVRRAMPTRFKREFEKFMKERGVG